MVFSSGKPDTFIAGADIEEFTRLQTQAELEALSRDGQEMLQRVADFPKPVIAAIHGACLGGGFELALACHYRIATDHPKTQLGLPEVQLGLLPGAGGCQRLPRLIGLPRRSTSSCAGKSVPGLKAFKLGMVDEWCRRASCSPTALGAAAAHAGAAASRAARRRAASPGCLLDRNPLGRHAGLPDGARRTRSRRPAGTTRRRSPRSRRSGPASSRVAPQGTRSSTGNSASSPSAMCRASWSSSSSRPPSSRRTTGLPGSVRRPAPVERIGGDRLGLHGRRHRGHRGEHRPTSTCG